MKNLMTKLSKQSPPSKLLLSTLSGGKINRPPLWLMRQAGRYLPEYRETRKKAKSFLEMCYSPELAVEVTLQPIRRFHFDAAILFSDILVIPDSLGTKVTFEEGKGPLLQTIETEEDLKKLSLERVLPHLSPVFETVKTLASRLPNDVTLIGFAGSPWTIATYMVEGKTSKHFEKVKECAYAKPVFFQRLIDIITDATSAYVIEQVKQGAEVIQLFDSWAGVLPEEAFHQWVILPTKKIVQRLKKEFPSIPVIGFPKGAAVHYTRYIKETGVDAVGVDYTLPLAWVKEKLQPQCAVQGNLDPVLLASNEQAMVSQAEKILETLGKGRFIFNLGHGILPHTPVKHVETLVNLVKNWKNHG